MSAYLYTTPDDGPEVTKIAAMREHAKKGDDVAYLKALSVRCDEASCHSRASAELFNRYNALLARLCGRHAKSRLRATQSAEKALDENLAERARLAAREDER